MPDSEIGRASGWELVSSGSGFWFVVAEPGKPVESVAKAMV